MKFSAFAVIAAAVAGVSAVPVDSGPLGHLQNRAADAIGGIASFIRREEAGHPVVPDKVRRSAVRFHNARDAERLRRRDDEGPNIGIPPFSTVEERGADVPDLTRRKAPEESVPPLAPFSVS